MFSVTRKLPRPIRTILNVARAKFFGYLGTLRLKIKPITLTDAQFVNALKNFENIPDFVSRLKSRANPSFFIDSTKKDEILEVIRERFPSTIGNITKEADEICNHNFDLLGSGKTNFGKEIDWHLDPRVNRRWPLVYPKGIDVDDFDKPSDIKIPWELSRCHHFITLAKAYWLTEVEKYAAEYRDEVESWIKGNPNGLGVNWLCTMDVAIRVSNWIGGWYFFKDSPQIDEKFMILFLKSVYLHGKYIVHNLENKGNFTSNHYLSDIVGLLYIAILFPEFKESTEWRDFALQELKKEIFKQVNPDGMDFEGSTCYHRLALELFYFSTLLMVINDKDFDNDYKGIARKIFGDEYVDRLYKMFEFVIYALKPNGVLPQIGDNDNGRLHIISEKKILDMRYLINFGAIFFNEPEFKISEFGFTEDALLLFGENGYKRWIGLRECSVKDLRSKAFPNSGVYVMRDKKMYIIIHCASNGQDGNGGHNHNDVLSFELSVGGEDLIVDPGTHNYSGDYRMRNLFRSSIYHNTLVVDGKEINSFDKRDVFGMKNEAKPKVLQWRSNEKVDLLEAEHYGYLKLHDPVVHRRKILFDKSQTMLRIEDVADGRGVHTYEIFFHFPPVPVVKDEENSLKFRTSVERTANISITPEPIEGLHAELREGWFSRSYGIKSKAPYLCYSKTGKAPVKFVFLICVEKEGQTCGFDTYY